MLSRKAKESIKVALAMVITYAISLSLDWDRAYWAAFAVAFVSLASIGQSMNKAALRMLGTLAAMVVALIFIELFAQERWPFILSLSVYGAFCAYMMSGSKHAYFWQVACFVTLVICFDAGPDSANAFDTAILRAQQTGLGILVYSLVAIFIWPSRSIGVFNAAVGELMRTEHQFYRACLDLAHGRGDAAEVRRLSDVVVKAKSHFDQTLDAAEIDSSEVWDLRKPWRRFQSQQMELLQALERWHESQVEVEALHLEGLLPGLEEFGVELNRRLAQIVDMLDGQERQQEPEMIELAIDQQSLRGQSHFNRAAVLVARSNLLRLEQLTRLLFETVIELKGLGAVGAEPDTATKSSSPVLPDLDRLASAFRFMVILWLAWLVLVYVGDVPGGTGLVSMAGSLGIAIVNMPQLPVSKLVAPVAGGVLFAGILYIFIMPSLSGFLGLGLMIFAATFAITYLYSEPQQILGRAMGLAMFASISAISNEQSYNFLSVATTATMFLLILLVFAISAYIPWSPRPERRFMRLLGRYFRSSDYLMSSILGNPSHLPTPAQRWRRAFHAREVASIPAKLGGWAPLLDDWVLSSSSQEQVQNLVTRLQMLSYRMERLLVERDQPHAPNMVEHLHDNLHLWGLGIQTCFQRLAHDPATGEQEHARERLDETLEIVEARIKELVDNMPDAEYSASEAESFYRLLGAFRAVSVALIDCAGDAAAIDWVPWQEERFA